MSFGLEVKNKNLWDNTQEALNQPLENKNNNENYNFLQALNQSCNDNTIDNHPSSYLKDLSSEFSEQNNPILKKMVFIVEKSSNSQIKKEMCFNCNIENCKKRYNQKWLLERHLICHLTGFKKFKCLFLDCPKIYKSKENMIFHYKNVHLKMKPFKCNFCEVAFSHRNGKIYHERRNHQDKLPFKCFYEGKSNFFVSD